MLLADLTSSNVAAARPATLVVPLGATEQHGAHLPLGTDTMIAEHVARSLVAGDDRCVLGPSVAIGASGEHAGFPGTLSIGTEALTALLVELVRDASRDYRRVVLVNAHGGNAAAIRAAQHTSEYEGRRLGVLYCAIPGADAHAGRTETSLMLAIAPHLVDLPRARPGTTTPIGQLMPQLRAGGVRAVSATGVLGDPTGASAAEGARLLTALLGRLQVELSRLQVEGSRTSPAGR